VERKLGHLMRRRHGGRRARVRGKRKVDADFNLLAAAQNLARLAVLDLRSTTTGWSATSVPSVPIRSVTSTLVTLPKPIAGERWDGRRAKVAERRVGAVGGDDDDEHHGRGRQSLHRAQLRRQPLQRIGHPMRLPMMVVIAAAPRSHLT
jgi:hypothetical protein